MKRKDKETRLFRQKKMILFEKTNSKKIAEFDGQHFKTNILEPIF
jgi:hypothetical protein